MRRGRKGSIFHINKYIKEVVNYSEMDLMGLTSSLESVLSTYVFLNKLINVTE